MWGTFFGAGAAASAASQGAAEKAAKKSLVGHVRSGKAALADNAISQQKQEIASMGSAFGGRGSRRGNAEKALVQEHAMQSESEAIRQVAASQARNRRRGRRT